jgi:hypothetical protein
MEQSIVLQRLINILQMRKSATSNPYKLLLTSALSLTPSLLQSICHSDDWESFCQYIHVLGLRDRLNALAPLVQVSAQWEGYKSLARLIVKGYFPIVLTTNIDSMLEEALDYALVEAGLRPHAFQTLILGRDTDDYIVECLDNSGSTICIVKLHGSLQDGVVSDAFPDLFELSPQVQASVQHYLNQDIIIVGPIEHESDLSRALLRRGKSSIYYALSRLPTAGDEVVKLIKARGNTPEAYMIAGPYGDFTRFFTTVEAQLLSPNNISSTQKDISSAIVREEWPATKDTPVTIFYSYAHSVQDEKLRDQLEAHLKILELLGRIAGWHKREILPGQDWAKAIDQHLNTAQIILLLISPDFIASPYCYGIEMMRALERQQLGETYVIPILLRPVFYEGAPFAHLSPAPTNGKAITTWANRDEAFVDIVEGLNRVLQDFPRSKQM